MTWRKDNNPKVSYYDCGATLYLRDIYVDKYAGYFCQNGNKYPCHQELLDENTNVIYLSNECGGKCAAGYYCPTYLERQLDALGHTIWPGAPILYFVVTSCNIM